MSKYTFEISRVVQDGEKLIALHLVGAPQDVIIGVNDDTDTFDANGKKEREKESIEWLTDQAIANCERLYKTTNVEVIVNI